MIRASVNPHYRCDGENYDGACTYQVEYTHDQVVNDDDGYAIRPATFPDYVTEDKSHYEIWWTFGWPYETSAMMARLVFSGIFDRSPNLKIITHHLGGMVPYFEGRVGPVWVQ